MMQPSCQPLVDGFDTLHLRRDRRLGFIDLPRGFTILLGGLVFCLLARLQAAVDPKTAAPAIVQTVLGPKDASHLGMVLPHEHVLVDFIGADKVSRDRYKADEAFAAALPFLKAFHEKGGRTLIECTPAYIGRDPALLKRLSEASGVAILTNTGYYGAAGDKFVPAHAHKETADELAARWTKESAEGIEGTGIKPGFLKIGVDAGPLAGVDRKLITAAARCHLRTGLAIAVHTGDGEAALGIIEVLKEEKVSPEAYIWVHAQNEKDRAKHLKAAEAGAWVEFDGLSEGSLDGHVQAALDLIERGHLGRLLFSHDAGWYHVGEPGGGKYRGYTFIFDAFLPALKKKGITEEQIRTLTVENPAKAFAIARRIPDGNRRGRRGRRGGRRGGGECEAPDRRSSRERTDGDHRRFAASNAKRRGPPSRPPLLEPFDSLEHVSRQRTH